MSFAEVEVLQAPATSSRAIAAGAPPLPPSPPLPLPLPPPLVVVPLALLAQGPHPFAHAEAALAEYYPPGCGLPLRYEFTWPHLNRGRHAEIALRDGAMTCVDPMTGVLLPCTEAHVLTGTWLGIAYRFEGREPFHLVTSHFEQAKLGLYFPGRNLFLSSPVDAGRVQTGCDETEALRRGLAGAVAHRARASDSGRARETVLHVGFCNNLGHFMWNDLAGLEAAVDSGLVRHADTVLCGPHEFFPLDALFPELTRNGIHVERLRAPLAPCTVHRDSLPLRLAGNRITRTLRRRIVAWALRSEAASLAELSGLNGTRLNLWCNLRLHNKTWVDQVEGIANLAMCLHASLPQGRPVHLILDGTPDTAPLVADIAHRVREFASVTDATRVPLAHSIALCALVDLHLCVVGSGLTLPHWVMGRRGVAHANRPHLTQQRFWNNVSEETHDVSFMPHEAVHEAAPLPGIELSYVNYRIDPPALLERMETQLRQLDTGPRQSGFAQAVQLAGAGRFDDAAERLINV